MYFHLGIATGSVYNDSTIWKKGFIGEGTTKKCLVVKTHRHEHDNQIHASSHLVFKRAIMILRNPYNAMLAEFNRQNGKGQTEGQGGHIGHAKPEDFRKRKFGSESRL